jgi:hypothetical protein
LIGGGILAIWSFVTVLVLVGLIDHWANPQQKNLSDLDLREYVEFSIWIFCFIDIVVLSLVFVSYRQKKISR